MTYNKMNITAVSVLALMLVGCGDGGDKADSEPDDSGGVLVDDPEPCATVAACKAALKDAEAALAALILDEDSTLGQVDNAETAVDNAETALDDAMIERAEYEAMQPPKYSLKALFDAIVVVGPGSDLPADVKAEGGKVTAEGYAKATWPVGDVAGFTEAVYENDGTSIVTHTNKMAAVGEKYSVYYADVPPVSMDDGWTYAPRTGVLSAVGGILTLDLSMAGAPISFDHGAGASATTMFEDGSEFSGTFHGVPGMFACTVSCTLTTNTKGMLTGASAGWTFTPDANTGDMIVDGVLTDAKYLDFGYWSTTMDGETSSVGTFASGAEQDNEYFATLTGTQMEAITATYNGGAAGLYSKREHSGVGEGDIVAGGRFTATADLTAHFGMGHTAPDDVNSIRGTISSFKDDGQPIDATWEVDLGKIGGAVPLGTFAETFTGGKTDGDGTWSGQFFGGSGDAAPTDVSGQFTNTFNNGNVIGAFGATTE